MAYKVEIKKDIHGIDKYYRDGIELIKGAPMTMSRILENEKLYEEYCSFFTAYPDLFIDLITPVDSTFELYFYQRIFLRAVMRYRYHYCVAPRAFSKTFISILGMILKCMFQPRSKCFICAPKKEQGAKIMREKVDEIFQLFPLLTKEYDSYTTSTDNLKIKFKNKSVFDVVAALDSQRGGRRHFGLVDEVRDHDGDLLNEVVLPLLNVQRRTASGLINPYEPHQAQFYMTSAGQKNSYAYTKLIELFEKQIIDPKSTFVWSTDYRVPMMHGLLTKEYLNDIKLSQTYKDETFAREYMSLWTGGGDDSWFDYDRISSYRTIQNPEKVQNFRGQTNIFYLISVDVGRLSCQTVATIFKVYQRADAFYIGIPNIFILGLREETKHFSIQASQLKQLIYQFDPKEVVIDGNGLTINQPLILERV